MVDRDWVKNLATARFGANGWSFQSPNDVVALKQARHTFAIEELLHAAEDYADAFNHYSTRKLSVLPLYTKQDQTKLLGVLMLVGNLHMQLRWSNETLIQEISEVVGFQTKTAQIAELALSSDPFGAVRWQTRENIAYSHEDLVKKALTDLVKVLSSRPKTSP